MIFTKRRKIECWLETAAPSPFSELLSHWLSGQMREQLTELGLTKLEFHIDWHDNYKCINIQGRYKKQYADIQIESEAFTVAIAEDEPDEPSEFPLTSAKGFYQAVEATL